MRLLNCIALVLGVLLVACGVLGADGRRFSLLVPTFSLGGQVNFNSRIFAAIGLKALFGLSMGMATTFVVVSSGVVISLIRRFVPEQVRIPMFTVIIATFVTAADYFLKANFYQISKALGPYVP